MLDIEKIAKSIVGFSDYFSLRIILLLLSCYMIYRYAWSPDYYGFASRIHGDLTTVVNKFSNDKLLGLFKLDVTVPFLSLFVLISLLDIHMKVLTFISKFFPLTFSLVFHGNYPLTKNEPAIFDEWTKVSGVYDYSTYKWMIARDFYDDLDPRLSSHTYGTIFSLISYLRAYGYILFVGAVFFPSIFVNHSRWHILAIALTLVLVSVFVLLIEQLRSSIKHQQETAYRFSAYIRKYNALKQIPSIERPQEVELTSPPKDKSRDELLESFVPSIRVYFVLPILAVEYDFRPSWAGLRRSVLRRTKPGRRNKEV
ncbi:hypothetical protein [Bradyrhizobium sp. AZCC 1577]|uniref:hypothetical protein n=1 Tax=Bradyrhizobium sp. AZCC 1577 TaxID=3117019 RepID=UPI002FF082DB